MKEPRMCPYNELCPEYGMETTEHISCGVGANFLICDEGRYVDCPFYAIQYRADDMNVRSNALSGAFLRFLREQGEDLEFIIVTDSEEPVIIRGFDNEKPLGEEEKQ